MATYPISIGYIRGRLTEARLEYVGSITIDHRFCEAAGFFDRQLVQIRNEQSGVQVETYVIVGKVPEDCPPNTICLNGASAHLFSVNDNVNVCATAQIPMSMPPIPSYHLDSIANPLDPHALSAPSIEAVKSRKIVPGVMIPYATGKVHRPRVTSINKIRTDTNTVQFPSVTLDAEWLEISGIQPRSVCHVVNVTTGRRDILYVTAAPAKSRTCEVTLGATDIDLSKIDYGYNVGDVLIVMYYPLFPMTDVAKGNVPAMRLCFPEEQPVDRGAPSLNDGWLWATLTLWNETKLAESIVDMFKLRTGEVRALDCSCGNAFPGSVIKKMGIDIAMSDGSDLAVEEAKKRITAATGVQPKPKDVRCVLWDNLTSEYGTETYDVLMIRGNSLPYVAGAWSAPSYTKDSGSVEGYKKLIVSLREVYKTLDVGGVLYVDCVKGDWATDYSFERNADVEEKGRSVKVKMVFNFEVKDQLKSRRFESTVTVTDKYTGEESTCYSDTWGLLLLEPELRAALSQTGFGPVFKIKVDNEPVYNNFLAFKPDPSRTKTPFVHQGILKQMKYDVNGFKDRAAQRELALWGSKDNHSFGIFEDLKTATGTTDAIRTAQDNLLKLMVKNVEPISSSGVLCVGSHDPGYGVGKTAIDNLFAQLDGKITPQFYSSSELSNISGEFKSCISIDTMNTFSTAVRNSALATLSQKVAVGGRVVICEALAGPKPVLPATQLYFSEKRMYRDLWSKTVWISALENTGLSVYEVVDISNDMKALYTEMECVATEMMNSVTPMENEEVDDEDVAEWKIVKKGLEETAQAISENEISLALIVCIKE